MCSFLRLALALVVGASWQWATVIAGADLHDYNLAGASGTGSYRRQLSQYAELPDLGPAPSVLPPSGGGVYAGGPIPETGRLLRVQDTTAYPFSGIGAVFFETEDFVEMCTGSLIAPNVVLTAAHCFYRLDTATEPAHGFFVPGMNWAVDDPSPLGAANITAVKFPSAYTKGSTTAVLSDVALVWLDRNFSTYLQAGLDTDLDGAQTLYTAGYPGNQCHNYSGTIECYMWTSACPMSDYNENKTVAYDSCMSNEGQSGSPLWVIKPETGQPLIIGVVTRGPHGPTTYDDTYTVYTVITRRLLLSLRRWVRDGPNANDPHETHALLDQLAEGW